MANVIRIVLLGAVHIAAIQSPARGDFSNEEKLDLVNKAAESWSVVHRWLAEYESIPIDGTEGVPGHRIMAISAPGEFCHLSAHFSSTHPWQVDPFCQEFFISQEEACHRWPFNRTCRESRLEKGGAIGGQLNSTCCY